MPFCVRLGDIKKLKKILRFVTMSLEFLGFGNDIPFADLEASQHIFELHRC
jgi:hypothetical protein